MKSWMFLLAAALSFGCSSEDKETPAANAGPDPATLGQLSLELTGMDVKGQAYRLRDASFAIDGYYNYYPYGGDDGGASQVLSSETDPDAATITTRVLPGSYNVTLQDTDWYLEKLVPGGAQRVEQAVLLSERTQYVYVYNRGVADVAFRFGVDGTLIDFRHGDVNIDLQIEHPDDGDGGTTVADAGRD